MQYEMGRQGNFNAVVQCSQIFAWSKLLPLGGNNGQGSKRPEDQFYACVACPCRGESCEYDVQSRTIFLAVQIYEVLRYNKDALPSTIEGFSHMRDMLLEPSRLY